MFNYYSTSISNSMWSSYIEGMIGQKFVSIVYTPCSGENIGEYDVSDSDEVIIALLKIEVHNKEYYKSYYDVEGFLE